MNIAAAEEVVCGIYRNPMHEFGGFGRLRESGMERVAS